MKELEVHFVNGGHCRHLLAAIDGRTLRSVTFQAVMLAIRHPELGWVVVDTGYGERFFAATRRWPYRLYRWATPVTLRGAAAAALARVGVKAEEVRHLILTHFHADHIGGLDEFPRAQVYYHEDAWQPLAALAPWRQTRAAFLPELVPADLRERSTVIGRVEFRRDEKLPFPVHAWLGDERLRLVELPGHAPGQVGLEFTASDGRRTLYCADAFWRGMQIYRGVDLPRPVLGLQWDGAAYRTTVEKLRAVAAAGTHRLLACHDDETQRYVAG